MAALRGAGTHFPCHNALDAICTPLTFQQPIYVRMLWVTEIE